jgi:hypothetical protein
MTILAMITILIVTVILILALIGGLVEFFTKDVTVEGFLAFHMILIIVIVFMTILITGSFSL